MAKKKKSKATSAPKPSISETISTEVIAAAYSSIPQPVFMKVCRLCEAKDGPFLNIFDADKVTAKKIDELMPFGIAENDDLPHKICFRCSAKLEELHEFVQKCIRTQESLRKALGKTGSLNTKTKTRVVWEEKLNKSNISNDDICDALIKKAMEGIKDIPVKQFEEEAPPSKRVTRRNETIIKTELKREINEDSSLNDTKVGVEKLSVKPINKLLRSSTDPETELARSSSSKKRSAQNEKNSIESKNPNDLKEANENNVKNPLMNSFSMDYEDDIKVSNIEEHIEEKPKKPFNIMDHISMIKVNGVGVLFQCKLCNRNFLKKEIVESHTCAKNGGPKIKLEDAPKAPPAPEPPKVSTVKYIKIDSDMKKTLSAKTYKSDNDKIDDSNKIQVDNIESPPKVKPKPKIGPASKTRGRISESNSENTQKDPVPQGSDSAPAQAPSVHMPSIPNLNGRFKLVPGPNNIFTLIEDSTTDLTQTSSDESNKIATKRKSEEAINTESKPKDRKKDSKKSQSAKSKSPEVINVEEQSKPYPVGLFQTVGHTTSPMFEPPISSAPATFTTPAMKKQSYTVVQTGNPSKLLISTKAQAPPAEVPKRRQKKSKGEPKVDGDPKEPFTVTLEDVAPPKDAGFFTFINVDPLLQPSYVLPTDNIIQESQISTSTAVTSESSKDSKEKDKYSCNMCGDTFSREKKLLAHIQSHYSKLDEEDQIRAEKTPKKKTRK